MYGHMKFGISTLVRVNPSDSILQRINLHRYIHEWM